MSTTESLPYILPELVLTATILVLFVGDLVIAQKERLGELALVGVAASLFAVARISHVDSTYLFDRMIVHDQFAVFFKVVFALATLAALWMSLGSKEVQRTSQGEYYGMLLASALGMFFMASASNLLMAYLSLEFVSLTSYVLTG